MQRPFACISFCVSMYWFVHVSFCTLDWVGSHHICIGIAGGDRVAMVLVASGSVHAKVSHDDTLKKKCLMFKNEGRNNIQPRAQNR